MGTMIRAATAAPMMKLFGIHNNINGNRCDGGFVLLNLPPALRH
jgi:hypothetical protein